MKAYYSGLRAWLLQRVSALYLLGFIVYFAARALIAPPGSFEAWRGWILAPAPRVATLIFFAALALHAWVGLRDVSIDYVKPLGLRLAVQSAIALGLLGILLWAFVVLFP